jgi:alcohol dehydrogenase, propanol-preferring
MQAMRLERADAVETSPLCLRDLPAPRPSAGEVAIAVEACGVCRTDLHIVEGEVVSALPIVPGHQIAGRILEVGEGVSSLGKGDRVGVGWLAGTCGACGYCRSGRENLCAQARFTGRDRDGGYAHRAVADARWVFRLPASSAVIESAPLLCAGIIGYRSLKLSGIAPDGRLGLFGFGASAHLAIQVARHWRCDVYVFTREEHHRRLALEMGAVWSGDTGDDPGIPLDAAVTFAPAGGVVVAALSRLAHGGTVAVNAIHMSPIPSFEYERLYGERVIRSVMNSTRADAEEFLDLAARIPVRATVERFPLARANDALLRIKRGQIDGAAVLEMPD